jgi:(5-formylfuran-3-yl)methyl phosphate synthase
MMVKLSGNDVMKLMISVISGVEAHKALEGGAEILDIKNPLEGALGAQFPSTIREIATIASDKLKISAAIGDMPHLPGTAALAALGAAVCNVGYIKVGLFGQRNESEAVAILYAIKQAVQDYDTNVIAAAYADYERTGSLNPKHLPSIADKTKIKGCLIDTAIKDGRRLFDFIQPAELQDLIQQAHETDLLFGIAGSLNESDLPIVRALNPDIVGFRSAVCCDGKRQGTLDAARVQKIKRLLFS